MRNVKKKDNEQWIELCEYVKKEILEYDDNMKFPQYLALKLQGIKRGEHIANNNHEAKLIMMITQFYVLLSCVREKLLHIYMRMKRKSKMKNIKSILL